MNNERIHLHHAINVRNMSQVMMLWLGGGWCWCYGWGVVGVSWCPSGGHGETEDLIRREEEGKEEED